MGASMFHNMFFLAVPILEKVIRPILIYLFLIVALRLAGKRELGQLNPFDLVVLLTLANTVQNAIIGEDNSVTGGIIGAVSLLLINFVVVRFLYNRQRLDHLIEGNPDALIEKGKIRMDRLKRELITMEQLESAAHRQGFSSLSDVEEAILEPGGALCMIARKPDPGEMRQRELLSRLDKLAHEIERLKKGTA